MCGFEDKVSFTFGSEGGVVALKGNDALICGGEYQGVVQVYRLHDRSDIVVIVVTSPDNLQAEVELGISELGDGGAEWFGHGILLHISCLLLLSIPLFFSV